MNQKALAVKSVDKLKAIINQPTVQEQFKNAMGKGSDLFVASLIDLFNAGLQDCDPGAVIQEALKAAVLKLPISKNLGFAYVIPYNKSYKEGTQWKKREEPQFQIGYKGMIQLAMRSGQVKNINAGPIYEGETVEENRLSGAITISGKPDGDKAIGYFAYMELINGFEKAIYITKENVIKHAKKYSKSFNNQKSAWTTNFDSMATKTPLRALFSKYAPMSIDFITAMQHDEEPEAVEAKNINLDMEELEPKKLKVADDKTEKEPVDKTKEFFGKMPVEPPFGE